MLMTLGQLQVAMLGRDEYMYFLVEILLGEDAAKVLKERIKDLDKLIMAWEPPK